MEQLGALAALGAAVLWTLNSVVTEKNGHGLDGGSLNFGRLALGLPLVTLLSLASGGAALPPWTGLPTTMLLVSGVIGFALGDTFIFKSFQTIGARVTLLVFSFAPVMTALLSFAVFGERLDALDSAGVALVLAGILLVVRRRGADRGAKAKPAGLAFALLAALGQAVGTIFSKYGLRDIGPLPATQVRLAGGLLGMVLITALFKKWPEVKRAAASPRGRLVMLSGAVLGTLFGVLLSMFSLKMAKAAVASALQSTMPVLILPVSVLYLREKLSVRDVAGAALSVAGIAVLFF